MSNLYALIQDLFMAHRILAREDVVDAYGCVSFRYPDNPNHFRSAAHSHRSWSVPKTSSSSVARLRSPSNRRSLSRASVV
jgi:hypothetical protein